MIARKTPSIEAKACAGGVWWYVTPSEGSDYRSTQDDISALLTRVIIRSMLQIVRNMLQVILIWTCLASGAVLGKLTFNVQRCGVLEQW